jgi:hypothetical protein
MATTFKVLNQSDDVTNTRTLLYESIPITSSIVSGTYVAGGVETNIYDYPHGMFQTVYDYPYASSSANNLFDITVGHNSTSPSYWAGGTYNSKKANIYAQMAKMLVGTDSTGSILNFDEDGAVTATADYKINSAFFINFSRLLVKDEIKKGSFTMNYSTAFSASSLTKANLFATAVTGVISDASGTTNYFSNSPVGEYGVLYANGSSLASTQSNKAVGLIFYQAGIAVLNTNIFAASSSASPTSDMSGNLRGQLTASSIMFTNDSSYQNVYQLLRSGSIVDAAEALRVRIGDISFQNTTELNSTIYFIRANNSEFNYSANPTYLSGSEIVVKAGNERNSPFSYITTVGLYSSDNVLLAVAKLSEPIKKSEDQSILLRVRLDY